MTLEQYIQLNHPDIMSEYQHFLRKEQLPEVGRRVEALVNGYGGYTGKTLRVVGYAIKGEKDSDGTTWGGNFIRLTDGKGEYLCELDEWWKEIKVV